LKGLVLSAGFGTRLKPYTLHTPKPLFTIAGEPLLGIMIRKLFAAGCDGVAVNTHHLAEKISAYIDSKTWPGPVEVRYEPEILGTGGPLRNFDDFFQNDTVIVVNSDVVIDLDFRDLIRVHQTQNNLITMVATNDPEFNTLPVYKDRVTIFRCKSRHTRWLTFTGIQIISPKVIQQIPKNGQQALMPIYRKLMLRGKRINVYIHEGIWKDIGTPERYSQATAMFSAPIAFEKAFNKKIPFQEIACTQIAGDGSDRKWYQFSSSPEEILIMGDHGIRKSEGWLEVDAFCAIGHHLFEKGVSVPQIYEEDTFSGQVFLEWAGTYLQDILESERKVLYQQAIQELCVFSVNGMVDFDIRWCYQTPAYNRQMILAECNYFETSFLQDYLQFSQYQKDRFNEYDLLVQRIAQTSIEGLMHRDYQARNILIDSQKKLRIIDFQGARKGPIQYDLASLLIDPYTVWADNMQKELLDFAVSYFEKTAGMDPQQLKDGFRWCAISRNLHILGAFAFLAQVKQKITFSQYIPATLTDLARWIEPVQDIFPTLYKTAQEAQICFQNQCGLTAK